MSHLCFSFSIEHICKILLFVIFLELTNIKSFGNIASSSYPFLSISFMPVTTRAQSKRLKNVNCGYSFINTSDSLLSPMTSTILPSSNVTSSAVQTVPICHVTLASSPDQPIITRCQDHDILSLPSLSPTPSSSLVVSNFQILEISNNSNKILLPRMKLLRKRFRMN